ncbi:hypothetical protein HYX10_03925 [Candidatus Woesearchaeota archaeon]|nr:hypothetical protein [Candidatus Woesearchaeota archaeon]
MIIFIKNCRILLRGGVTLEKNGEADNLINEAIEPVQTPSKRKKVNYRKVGVLFLVAIAIVAVFYLFSMPGNGETAMQVSFVEGSARDLLAESPLVSRPETSAFEGQPGASEVANILLEEAASQGIQVSDEAAESFIQKSLDAYQMSEEELAYALEASGIAYSRYKESVKSQLMIAELLQKNVDLESVEVSDREVDEFIEANEEEFRDFFDDEEMLAVLKQKVHFKLLQDRQAELVMDYMSGLT